MKRLKTRLGITVSCVLILLVCLSGSVMAQTPTPLSIGYSVWVGYGPLFIAKEKGYFADNGLDVTLTDVENPGDRFTALAGGQLNGLVTTLDTMAQYCNAETPYKAILGLDESSGGDGIVANGDIKTVADLKGKTVGVNVGTVSQFFLEYVLKQNGMTDKDLTMVRMSQGDVPAALGASRVDAGVTWEPHLSKAVDAGAHRVIDSKSTPGLIVDILVLRQDVIDKTPGVPEALVKAWNSSIDFWKQNPDEAATIMAKGLGSFYETADDINADLAGVTLFDAEKNAKFFGSTGEGTATGTLDFALKFLTDTGTLTDPCKSADMIDPSYVAPGMMATAEATMGMTAEATMSATAEATP